MSGEMVEQQAVGTFGRILSDPVADTLEDLEPIVARHEFPLASAASLPNVGSRGHRQEARGWLGWLRIPSLAALSQAE